MLDRLPLHLEQASAKRAIAGLRDMRRVHRRRAQRIRVRRLKPYGAKRIRKRIGGPIP